MPLHAEQVPVRSQGICPFPLHVVHFTILIPCLTFPFPLQIWQSIAPVSITVIPFPLQAEHFTIFSAGEALLMILALSLAVTETVSNAAATIAGRLISLRMMFSWNMRRPDFETLWLKNPYPNLGMAQVA